MPQICIDSRQPLFKSGRISLTYSCRARLMELVGTEVHLLRIIYHYQVWPLLQTNSENH